jgi:RNA polymerase sigma-70 factor (ECF subfamily)
MTVFTPSMPVLIREQPAQPTVETSAIDAEVRALVAAISRGDETAFGVFYERYHSRLFRLALVLNHGDESLAQDTVQAVFITAARKLRHADSEEHLWNWLARIARQQQAKVWRKQQRGARIVTVEPLPESAAVEKADSVLEEILDAALNKMKPEERQVIESFYFDRVSQKELAEQLNTTPKAVSSRLERAREKLRSLIKRKLSHEV